MEFKALILRFYVIFFIIYGAENFSPSRTKSGSK